MVLEGTEPLYIATIGWQDFSIVDDTTLSTVDIIDGVLDNQLIANELLVNSSSTFTNVILRVYDVTGKELMEEV